MENRADKLRALLKKYDLQSPADDFTGEVIKEINAGVDSVYTPMRLKSVLSRNLTAEPSTGFTYSVLNKVKDKSQIKYPPIISRRAWALIIVFIITCLVISVGMNGYGGQVRETFLFRVGNYLSAYTSNLREPFFYSGVITLSAGSLLLIDYLVKKVLRPPTTD